MSENKPDLEYNIYCSTSIDNNRANDPVLVLGAVICPAERSKELERQMFDLKKSHPTMNIARMRWSRVSDFTLKNYMALVKWFFWKDDLQFSTLVIPGKELPETVDTELSGQNFYTLRLIDLLRPLLVSGSGYNIHVEQNHHASRNVIEEFRDQLLAGFDESDDVSRVRVQTSSTVYQPFLMLSEVLTGAISYSMRGLSLSHAKHDMVTLIRLKTGRPLTKDSPAEDRKFRLWVWEEMP